MNILALSEDLFQGVLAGDVGEQPELHLRVVRGDQQVARLGDEAGADLPPSGVRIGMFCRFGLLDERRPVVAAV